MQSMQNKNIHKQIKLNKGKPMKSNLINFEAIAELDFKINLYTLNLYERAGGKIIPGQPEGVLLLSDLGLHSKCLKRATKKYIKIKQRK